MRSQLVEPSLLPFSVAFTCATYQCSHRPRIYECVLCCCICFLCLTAELRWVLVHTIYHDAVLYPSRTSDGKSFGATLYWYRDVLVVAAPSSSEQYGSLFQPGCVYVYTVAFKGGDSGGGDVDGGGGGASNSSTSSSNTSSIVVSPLCDQLGRDANGMLGESMIVTDAGAPGLFYIMAGAPGMESYKGGLAVLEVRIPAQISNQLAGPACRHKEYVKGFYNAKGDKMGAAAYFPSTGNLHIGAPYASNANLYHPGSDGRLYTGCKPLPLSPSFVLHTHSHIFDFIPCTCFASPLILTSAAGLCMVAAHVSAIEYVR